MEVMYCLPATYLWFNPVDLSTTWCIVALSLHLIGYITFLDSNTQRTQFRRDMETHGENSEKVKVGYLFGLLGAGTAKYVVAKWMAADGKPRTSYLLTNGYWGLARHFNYLAGSWRCCRSACTSCNCVHARFCACAQLCECVIAS
jgi:7-dehydrocholesterol reductase